MPVSFNLIDEPWLPCVMPGGALREYGLMDALVNAHRIRELRDQSPLVTASLHRLLLAILHRVFGPADVEAWHSLWQSETLPGPAIEDYLAKWRDRFDLFDARRPFYQTAGFSTDPPSGINRLAQELARNHNPTLFDHTDNKAPPAFTPAEAARFIVAEQAFAIRGGRSPTGRLRDGPLPGGAVVLPWGRTFRETLLLNLVTYDGEDQPFAAEEDAPTWESNREGALPLHGMPASPSGYLDLLTWQSRTLNLHPEEEGDRVVVRHVSYAQGRRFLRPPGLYDPAFAIRRNKNGDWPVQFVKDRAVWRDSAALFRFSEVGEFLAPRTFQELANRRIELEKLRPVYGLAVIGLCADDAKVNFWRHEQLPLPLAYLGDQDLVADLQRALELTECVGGALQSSVLRAAQVALSPANQDKADGHRVKQVVISLAPERLYWSRMGQPFLKLLTELPGDGVAEADPLRRARHRGEQLWDWFQAVLRPTARDAYDQTAGRLDSSSRAHRAAVEGRAVLDRELGQIAAEHPHRPSNTEELRHANA